MKKLFFLLFALLASNLYAQDTADISSELAESIQKRIEYGQTPSMAIGIIDENGPRTYMYGHTSLNGTPVDEHTVYEIGSISKVFTAILLAQLSLDGKVAIDDPVERYLPEDVRIPSRNGNKITLGHLSDHTSALTRLPANMNPANPANPYADYTVEAMYAFLSEHELRRDIGAEYEYSNLAQGLLGHTLALVAGTSYEELIIDIIADPLGMKETKITLDKQMSDHLAKGYSNGVEVENWDLPTLAGAGAIRSSTHDMLLFLAANIGLNESSLYPAMQLSHMQRHDKAGMGVGLAWHIAPGENGDVIWHNGGTGGYRTFAGFVNETRKGVVVLTNSTAGADDIGFHLLNPAAELIEIKPSAARELKKLLDNGGISEGVQFYKKIEVEESTKYDFSEGSINSLGYTYLGNEDIEKALAVFKLNIESFPNSANAYDSYGEALRKNNQLDLAIANYKKSVELNPGNTHGIDMLREMGVDIEAKEVVVPESVLQKYVGTYNLAPSFDIVVTNEGAQLFLQATGQPKFELFASSNTEFYLKVVEARVVFHAEGDDVASRLVLFQGGQEVPGTRVTE